MQHPRELLNAYVCGQNIISLLKDSFASDRNTEEMIELAYDLQTGSYIEALNDPDVLKYNMQYGRAIAEEILTLTAPSSILEAGIGEGTTLKFVCDALSSANPQAHGFDISFSRIACCRDWLAATSSKNVFLSVASLFHLPYTDSCFDIVYTSHSIEPNGGHEKEILKELYRVASRYLILLEPGYELSSEKSQRRMREHGYCRDLVMHAGELNMQVIRHELFPSAINPLNPTAITVISKNPSAASAVPSLACPRFGDPLMDYGDSLFSPDSLRAYPKILGIPCLRQQDGIVASKYESYNSN